MVSILPWIKQVVGLCNKKGPDQHLQYPHLQNDPQSKLLPVYKMLYNHMKVSELCQAAKWLQITLSRNLVKQEIVDQILLQAQPQQLNSVIQKASCNSKQNDMTTEELADHSCKHANEWYKKTKQKQDAESVHAHEN